MHTMERFLRTDTMKFDKKEPNQQFQFSWQN